MSNKHSPRQYTMIPQRFLECLARISLTDYERRVLEVIMRHTWGYYQNKAARISYRFIASKTGIDARHAYRACGKLEEKYIISRSMNSKGPKGTRFEIQDNPDNWNWDILGRENLFTHAKRQATSNYGQYDPSRNKD